MDPVIDEINVTVTYPGNIGNRYPTARSKKNLVIDKSIFDLSRLNISDNNSTPDINPPAAGRDFEDFEPYERDRLLFSFPGPIPETGRRRHAFVNSDNKVASPNTIPTNVDVTNNAESNDEPDTSELVNAMAGLSISDNECNETENSNASNEGNDKITKDKGGITIAIFGQLMEPVEMCPTINEECSDKLTNNVNVNAEGSHEELNRAEDEINDGSESADIIIEDVEEDNSIDMDKVSELFVVDYAAIIAGPEGSESDQQASNITETVQEGNRFLIRNEKDIKVFLCQLLNIFCLDAKSLMIGVDLFANVMYRVMKVKQNKKFVLELLNAFLTNKVLEVFRLVDLQYLWSIKDDVEGHSSTGCSDPDELD